jgi:hypothetical protein
MRYSVTTRQGHQIIYSVPHGARVEVGYWDLGAGADAMKLDAAVLAAACARPPDFVITYPLDGSRLSWQHWTAEGDLHPNSADSIEFAGGVLKLVQYRTADWTGAGEEKTVRFTPGPDAPYNLVSRITGVHDRKAPWKATLADLFVHTAAKDQTKAAVRLVQRIRALGGACEESTVTLEEIPTAVAPSGGGEPRVHVYVGDMIQIQRMSRGPGPYPVDLDVNLYTDHHDVVAPLFLAPFGKKNS